MNIYLYVFLGLLKLNNNQKAAILSYSYNAGPGALKTWGITAAIKSGNYAAAASDISRGPITSKGVTLEGLIRRRKKEATLFTLPVK